MTSTPVDSAISGDSGRLRVSVRPTDRHTLAGHSRGFGRRTLQATAITWFVAIVIGQLLMATYVVVFYGRAALAGTPERWNQVLHNGHIPGDSIGNLTLALHLVFATVIVVLGALQLVPAVRRRWPRLHRWSGRVYLVAAAVLSLGGLYLIWTRASLSGLINDIAISVNALLILGFAAMALRCALHRRFDQHRRWALRLFIAVGGVWFFRVGLMFWILINQGPVGFDPASFQGPALVVLGFAQFLLPLAVLELYLRAEGSRNGAMQLTMAVALAMLTAVMGIGIMAASRMMWLPLL